MFPQSRTSRVDFHKGQVLWQLAKTYPSLMLTLVEAMQNGIDAEATEIFVGINLKNRSVIVADNGHGVTLQKFEQALASVGRGIKASGKLGRFGLGLISPLDKCTSFVFTSCAAGTVRPLAWTFRGEDIKAQHVELQIPQDQLNHMPAIPAAFRSHAVDQFQGPWRTMVRMTGITQDKVISIVDIDELETHVRSKLGQAMRKQGTTIRVVLITEQDRVQVRDISPIAYTGEPLSVVSYDGYVDAGSIEFELFRANKLGGVRRGQVVVVEAQGNYPITMHEFVRQARGRKWGQLIEAALDALASGYFEGIIRCKNIELHPERTKFVYNDALLELYMAISDWYEQYGQAYYEGDQDQTREQRYQDLGLKSQGRLQQLLKQAPFVRLWEGLKAVVQFGRLGDGHVEPGKGKPDGLEEDSSIRAGQGGAGVPRTPREATEDESSGSTRERESKDRPGDLPLGVTGPRGNRRKLVQGDSQGLWFEYSWLEGSSRLWEFDFERGILTFNVRHPVWVQLDETDGKHLKKNDKWIMHLQEWLALEVLHLLLKHPSPEDFEAARSFIDDQIKHYVEMFVLPSTTSVR